MTSSRESDAYVAPENRPLISRIENSNQEPYGHSYGGDYGKTNEQPGDVFHSEELTSNGEAFGQYGILPEGLQHSYRPHRLFTQKASRMHLYPQEDEFSTIIPLPAYSGMIRESHDQHGNNVMPLLSSSQETYIPTISLHDSSSALLLPDAPYLTEDSEWARNVQNHVPASAATSGPSSVLSPFSSSADLLHKNEAFPRYLAMARKGASHKEEKISGGRTERKKAVQIEGRVIPKELLESENRVFLGKDSRKHGNTEPRRLLGGIETQSNLEDHCYETLTVEPNRGCPFDFTLEIFKDDSIKSPVLVCMGVRVLPSEALCAGKVVDSRCLVETKRHAKWFCPLDVVVEQAPEPKIKKSLPKPGEPKKMPGSHSESEKVKDGSSKQEQTEKKPTSRSASASTERSSSAAVLDASSAPRHAQGTNSTDPNVKKPGEETAKDEREKEVDRARHPRPRQLENVVTPGRIDRTGVSVGPWADALFVNKAEDAGSDRSAFRQLGKLPFALLVMEINERRKVSDPKQRMKDEVEKMNSSRKIDVDAALHHSVASPVPPVPPSPGQKEGKRMKDIKAKKLSDPPEPPPTGLCYREQIVDQIVVCPEGYNVTPAQACQATSQPVVTCHAVGVAGKGF
ncbi:hypothetical protein TGME49_224680 [Toxoplasma gondii ME49]|uniref:Uncharacterized protein n=3 Tax=Toxoplasma gondii TaxID=5811 RepID=A0A086KMN1_TOXGO|nr:hypothetical protein TGME49_224680 [Toxoplasma gondii ME49]EPT26967.1 hypothetical protein TGME49_224680 [Toxoplasma gondii ME49]KFG45649.1 hypothetical protein TGDOM2_224680 [Toxoplasma gondii GAB2-2007-GAL-DOM2]KYF42133.1 hypothetical protein TGARI_224680 [Toxoplasma gondii ARI]|eukprot:XP_018635953.1 hypothetical protein TGME49_224680 [Toxoplasma gondii ME49]